MNARKTTIPLILLLLGAALAACTTQATPTPEPQQPTQPPATAVPTQPPPTGPQEVPVTEITNITWQWTELIENQPAAQSLVPDPENYTLTFFEDGTFGILADCNSGNGSYTVSGNTIEFGPMALTLAMCPPESLHDQFMRLLGQVDTFGMLDGMLVFTLQDGAGEMRFQNGGMAEKPEAPPEEVRMFVGPEKVPCEGAGPMECLQVKYSPEDEWQLFYNTIEGFQWEPGFFYELRVNVYQVENPPADGSSLRYELVEVVSKIPVELGNTTGIDPASISINTFDLPYSYQPNLVQATPYDNTQPPGTTGLPQHIQINFGVTSPADVQPNDPIFYLIPKQAYLDKWQAAGDDGVKNTMGLLDIYLTQQTLPLPTSGMPVLPPERVAGFNDLAVQGKYLKFENGYGVRFVGRFNQDPNPVTNEGLFYIFQGYSQDGVQLFSFFYPVSTSVLPNSVADVAAQEMSRFNQDPVAYVQDRAQTLNAMNPADWEPNLETLDGLVASLNYQTTVEAPPQEASPLENVQWQWTRFSDPLEAYDVPAPESYWVIFKDDGSLSLQADCNSGSGSYTTEGSSIAIALGALTQAFCGEESLSDAFLTNLGAAAIYAIEGDQLRLDLFADGGQMFFINAGVVQ